MNRAAHDGDDFFYRRGNEVAQRLGLLRTQADSRGHLDAHLPHRRPADVSNLPRRSIGLLLKIQSTAQNLHDAKIPARCASPGV